MRWHREGRPRRRPRPQHRPPVSAPPCPKDVQRNRAALLEAAQRHFLKYGVGTSLEAVAKEAGVGPATMYRHVPTREALPAAVLRTRSGELVARRAEIAQLGDAAEALRQWLRAIEVARVIARCVRIISPTSGWVCCSADLG
ncbi:TetR/AcrR family transcriptional regulator [Streptomyces griseoloalbus]|uniref:TetR/AcrR family transcriptional regulator n=1 Tax=Streptomyces griseoloalbus TaxID=67303 RepID=UPI001613B7A2|nr:TetR family transcriptional regulator [Streptomyces albaduncus]